MFVVSRLWLSFGGWGEWGEKTDVFVPHPQSASTNFCGRRVLASASLAGKQKPIGSGGEADARRVAHRTNELCLALQIFFHKSVERLSIYLTPSCDFPLRHSLGCPPRDLLRFLI